jgi:hypothetical protein
MNNLPLSALTTPPLKFSGAIVPRIIQKIHTL